jgi:hypothetical protein
VGGSLGGFQVIGIGASPHSGRNAIVTFYRRMWSAYYIFTTYQSRVRRKNRNAKIQLVGVPCRAVQASGVGG